MIWWATAIGLTVLLAAWSAHNVRMIRKLHADGVKLGDFMARSAVVIAARNLLALIDRGAVGDVEITMAVYDQAIEALRIAVAKADAHRARIAT